MPSKSVRFLRAAETAGVVDRFGRPTRGNSRGEEGFCFRREVESAVVNGVEERLDAEAIASSEERALDAVHRTMANSPRRCERHSHAHFFVEVKNDFAVRAGAQTMSARFEFLLSGLVVVQFAVHNDAKGFIFVGDRLIPGGEIDDAKARVAESNTSIRGKPVALAIRAAMTKTFGARSIVSGETGAVREYMATIPHIGESPPKKR